MTEKCLAQYLEKRKPWINGEDQYFFNEQNLNGYINENHLFTCS